MSDTKWTPGPWRLLRRGRKHRARISGASWSGFARVVVRMGGSSDDSAEGMANARLISAAPELHSALADACLQIEYLHAKFNPTGSSEAVLARSNQVLAKARGEPT